MPLFSVTVREHSYTGSFYSDVVEAESARDALRVAAARAVLRQMPATGRVPGPGRNLTAAGSEVPPLRAGPAVGRAAPLTARGEDAAPGAGAGTWAGSPGEAPPGLTGEVMPASGGGAPLGLPREVLSASRQAPPRLPGDVVPAAGEAPSGEAPSRLPGEDPAVPGAEVPPVPGDDMPAPAGEVVPAPAGEGPPPAGEPAAPGAPGPVLPPALVTPRGFSVVIREQAGAGPVYSDTVQAGSAAEALEAAAAQAAAPQPAGPEAWADPEGRPRCPDVWIYSLLHCERPAGHEPPHEATARGYGRVVRWVRDARGIAEAVPRPGAGTRAVPPAVPPAGPQPLAEGPFGST